MKDELILLGQIVRYQGNKGHVRVEPLTNNPERFFQLESVVVEKPGDKIRLKIESAREQNDFVVLKLESIDDIDAAEALKGSYLSLPESELPELSPYEYYIYRIKDFTVKTDDDRYLGKLEQVWTNKGTDIFLVQSEDGDEYLVPAAREIILSIDREKQEIIIKPLPGLLDL